jgi:hypothetical protein
MKQSFFENEYEKYNYTKIDNLLYNKRVRPTKNEPQQGISYLKRVAGEGQRERWRLGGSAGTHI